MDGFVQEFGKWRCKKCGAYWVTPPLFGCSVCGRMAKPEEDVLEKIKEFYLRKRVLVTETPDYVWPMEAALTFPTYRRAQVAELERIWSLS